MTTGAAGAPRVRSLLAVGVVLGAALVAAPGPAPVVAAPQAEARTTARATCPDAGRPFRPTSVRIPGVTRGTRVLARGRDGHGSPLPPPLTARGKWQLAWDKRSGIRPGSAYGVVRMLAHTYPRDGSYGSALGNRLLDRLRVGARIVVTGSRGQLLCYRVERRTRVRATASMSAFYSATGRPRIAILVCSGRRRGPGDWSHRTIWFAAPVGRR